MTSVLYIFGYLFVGFLISLILAYRGEFVEEDVGSGILWCSITWPLIFPVFIAAVIFVSIQWVGEKVIDLGKRRRD